MKQNARQMVLDAEQLFGEAETLTSTGVIGSSINLKGGLGLGSGTIVLIITALDIATGDETYDIDIEVSTDNATWVKWGSISDAEIQALTAGDGRVLKPFHNQGSEMYNYVRLNATLAGTTPSITLTAFLSETMI